MSSIINRPKTTINLFLRRSAAIIALYATISGTLEQRAKAAPVAAQPADAFIDSMGVNVHAHPPYTDKHEMLKARLSELGIRHVRDGNHEQACRYAAEFFKEMGIKTTFIMGRRVGGNEEWKSPLDLGKLDTELREIKELALTAAEAIQGPNEYDIHSDARDADWPGTLRAYQKQLYNKVKADPALAHLPVIAPSLTSEKAFAAVGDLDAYIDRSCAHLYQSTRPPGTPGWGANGYGSIQWTLDYLLAKQSPSHKPTWSTECGYNSELSESAETKYLPRMFAEFFRRGFERSFKYELYGKQWGLIREDGSPKPAFIAVQNLIALLKDPGPSFTPTSLDFDLTGQTSDVRTLVLEKRDGAFFVVLWREVPGWDVDLKKEISVTPASVRLRCDSLAKATLHTLDEIGKLSASTPPIEEGKVIQLNVPDSLMILELRNTASH